MGSTNANLVGLYHYTVTTNDVIEGTNIVSIGYHYVALDQYGNLLDSNGDGIPDYLEDANGDGIVDNGETNWALAILTQPESQTIIQGATATFNVVADGVPPISYQWYFDTTNAISGETNTQLAVRNVQTLKEGGYLVVVSNFSGSLTSVVANLVLSQQTMVVAWGDDSYGQCDVPSGLTNAIDVAGGTYFSLALKSDGTVVVWGEKGYSYGSDKCASRSEQCGRHCGQLESMCGTQSRWNAGDVGSDQRRSARRFDKRYGSFTSGRIMRWLCGMTAR